MGQYSIKELEKLSGIKAHTIRIWEKRHRIINPTRTSTNIRLYSDNDLKKIINVAIVNNAGVKISHIARLSSDELNRMVGQESEKSIEVAPIDQMIVAMVDLDEPAFEKLLAKLAVKMGFENLIVKVVYPFLEKIGILWQTGNITPSQEHFISNLIRQKIIVAIDGLPYPSSSAAKALLFLPENEYHEIGLLFYHYLARKSGLRTIYLGQSVPYGDLKQIVESHRPKFIITSIVSTLNNDTLDSSIDRLATSNFVRLAISAENWNGGQEAISDLNDFAVRKECVRTRARREPIAHLTKASNQHCLVIPSRLQQVGNNGIHIQGTDNGSSTIDLPDDFYSRKADATHGSNHRRRRGSKSTIHAELLQSLKDSPLKP